MTIFALFLNTLQGNMANMFFPTLPPLHPFLPCSLSLLAGIIMYYIITCLYLLGDLSIYAVSVSTSITKVIW